MGKYGVTISPHHCTIAHTCMGNCNTWVGPGYWGLPYCCKPVILQYSLLLNILTKLTFSETVSQGL